MFIQTDTTPNPASLKFLPGRVVMERGTADFRSVEEANSSLLAQNLFKIEGVEGVFFGSDFISITKSESFDWQVLKPSVLGAISDHYQSGAPIMNKEENSRDDATAVKDSDIVVQIKELLDTRVRPAVAQDGGDITKSESFNWQILKPSVLGAISVHYESGASIIDKIENTEKNSTVIKDSEIVVQIKELLDTKVRPAVAMDGGDITFSDFKDGIVFLHMKGACSGCPSSTATLKAGIENMLKHYVPEVQGVEPVMN